MNRRYIFESVPRSYDRDDGLTWYTIQAWEDCARCDLDYLVGSNIVIDGIPYKVLMIDRFPASNYLEGYPVGVAVEFAYA